mmetsp:Transcript_96626/g.277473  ORF Transcript_96626/g.277473 Transcript_96626/m.277473 type:complete len:313 (-) Transcript_96626:226-1164(-)
MWGLRPPVAYRSRCPWLETAGQSPARGRSSCQHARQCCRGSGHLAIPLGRTECEEQPGRVAWSRANHNLPPDETAVRGAAPPHVIGTAGDISSPCSCCLCTCRQCCRWHPVKWKCHRGCTDGGDGARPDASEVCCEISTACPRCLCAVGRSSNAFRVAVGRARSPEGRQQQVTTDGATGNSLRSQRRISGFATADGAFSTPCCRRDHSQCSGNSSAAVLARHDATRASDGAVAVRPQVSRPGSGPQRRRRPCSGSPPRLALLRRKQSGPFFGADVAARAGTFAVAIPLAGELASAVDHRPDIIARSDLPGVH